MPYGAADQTSYEFGYGDGRQNTHTPPYGWLRAWLYENSIDERHYDDLAESYERGVEDGRRAVRQERQYEEAAA